MNETRVKERLELLSQIGRFSEGGVKRIAHSKEDEQALQLVEQWMKEAGMTTAYDRFGNLIGEMKGRDASLKPLVLGSHVDTQPYAGRFDGTIGVIGAIEVVQSLKEAEIPCSRSIEVVSFADEEGCRFNEGLFGSRGLIGEIDEETFEQTDETGISREQALAELLQNKPIIEKRYTPENVHAFIEMHIEQGPKLEEKNLPVGIVSGIAGPLWLEVEVTGFSGHAGTVPMASRQDALVGASRIIHLFHEHLRNSDNPGTVGTVGSISVFPNSINAIPEKVNFTVDLRDIDVKRRKRYESYFYKLADKTEKLYFLSINVATKMESDPTVCSNAIRTVMRSKAAELGLEPFELASGAFHDALTMAKVAPFGMIFVRCKKGISHHPDEFAALSDITLGTQLLYMTTLNLCK